MHDTDTLVLIERWNYLNHLIKVDFSGSLKWYDWEEERLKIARELACRQLPEYLELS